MLLVFSDVHANRQAFDDLVLVAKETTFEHIVCCGDVVGHGRDFEYVIDGFLELGVKSVAGNHDRMVSDGALNPTKYRKVVSDPLLWTRENIKGKYLEYLVALPETLEVGPLFVKHTLGFDDYVLRRGDAQMFLPKTNQPLIALGHTHVMNEWHFASRKVFNPGSITKGRRKCSRGYTVVNPRNLSIEFIELEPIL